MDTYRVINDYLLNCNDSFKCNIFFFIMMLQTLTLYNDSLYNKLIINQPRSTYPLTEYYILIYYVCDSTNHRIAATDNI